MIYTAYVNISKICLFIRLSCHQIRIMMPSNQIRIMMYDMRINKHILHIFTRDVVHCRSIEVSYDIHYKYIHNMHECILQNIYIHNMQNMFIYTHIMHHDSDLMANIHHDSYAYK